MKSSTKPRVIHLISSLHSGGCENMLLRTLPYMDKNFDHTIITLKEPGELAPAFKERGIAVTHFTNSGGVWNYGQHLARFVAAKQPALVITYLFHADVAGRLFLAPALEVPVVPFLRTTYNFRRYWPARLFEKLTFHRVQQAFANSAAVKDYYVAHMGAKPRQITVIPNGIDLARFHQATGRRLVEELKLPSERLVITCVANLAPNKGHTYLLTAFTTIARDYPYAFLLIVGEGGERASLEQQAARSAANDRIRFLGRRQDIPEILALTDIFVLPTLFEGMSNAVLEAMAAGCAVVTTDIPENRAVVDHEQTGLLVPRRDVVALTQALTQLAAHATLRARLGKHAQAAIQSRFELPAVAAQWAQAITQYAHG